MKANSTHISLETAKLLKNCGVESNYWWILHKEGKKSWDVVDKGSTGPNEWTDFAPAYTWQEILWEYPQEFFGEDAYDTFGGFYRTCRFAVDILDFLQDKEYDKADKYFRDNCILIK